jgi:Tol biopolymer transport system component
MTLLKRKVTIALCALLLCIPPLAPAKIVFTSNRDGRGIYVMDDDGSNVQRLTFPSPHESDSTPRWSYDGSRIVFHRNVSAIAQQIELFVMDKDGSNVEQLTHYKSHSGAGTWSPDGKHISYRQAIPPLGSTTIYVMRADGTGQAPLVRGDEWYRYTGGWSKDSESVLYFETRLGEDRVVIQKLGTKARRILKTPKKWQIHAACFIGHDVLISADKDSNPETNADIYRYHISTGKLTNLTNHPADDYGGYWSHLRPSRRFRHCKLLTHYL